MALAGFYESKIETAEREITQKTSNLRRLEAQRYQLNNRVRRLKEELQLLQQPASYVGEVIKTMGKKKVLVKVHPEGKYGKSKHQLLCTVNDTCSGGYRG
jgi:26S proteasome regulatory subunit T6